MRFIALLLFIAFAPCWVAAQTPVASVEGITEYRLANGLQVLLVPDDAKPSTTVNVTYRVGSRHEGYGETGMAHLLEHLIFKGTPTTKNLLGEFSRRGLRANGSTSLDRTNYFASWSANDDNLRWYLSWQADAMVNSLIARADLDSEMTVVRNEMESGENNPSRILVQQMLASMYQWHNYGKGTIGARSDVENVDIARLQAFYRRHYQPDNATLIVAGKFDRERTLAWVQQYFAPIAKPTRVLERTYTLDPAQDGERSVTLRRNGGAPLVYLGYHVMPGAHPDFAAVSVLGQVFGDAPGGRLHKRLVQTQKAASAFGGPWGLAEPGPLFFGLQLAPGQDVETAKSEMLKVIDSIGSEPVTAEELERARTQLLNEWEQGFNDPEIVGVQLSSAIGLGDWRLYFLERDGVRRVTLADVNRVANERLKRDNRTVGIYLPTAKPERAPAPQTVDVAALVRDYKGDATAAATEAFDASPANLDARTRQSALASGMKVALLAKASRGNVVQARLRLNYGDVASLKDQASVGSLLAALMDKGGGGLTRQQFSDRLDQLRAEVSFSAEEQALVVSAQTRRDQLPELITLLGAVLRAPTLAAESLEEVRRQRLAALERQRSEPNAVAGNALERLANPYPKGDLRYAPSFDETAQTLASVNVEQLRAFHRRFYSAASAEFAAVGAMNVEAVQKALVTAFGNWNAPAAGALAYQRAPRPFVALPNETLSLATPDKPNATLRLTQPLPVAELHPDYPALMVFNEVFSAGPGSRLWDRMREREGLTYGVQSAIVWNAYEPHSRFIVVGIFAPQNRAKMDTALREETARVLKDGISADEFTRLRDGLLQQRKLTRAQDVALAGGLARNLQLGRSFAVSQQVDDALARLTVAEVNAAMRKYIDPAKWAIAWAGDFKAP
jgi:zinc protease